MVTKHRLGRGLDSLIPDLGTEDAAQEAGVLELPIKQVELNPKQPRLDVDEEELRALAASIRRSGVLQPILVRPAGEGYELVAGERRLRAAHLAGLEMVPAVVRDVPDEKMLELALVENIQRTDLNAIEKAKAMRQMIDELGLTQEETGNRLGLSRPAIANLLRLLELPEDIQQMVSRETLTAGHARALLALEEDSARRRLARQVAKRGLSVRETERLAAREGSSDRKAPRREPAQHLAGLEESLAEALGVRVEVKPRKRGGRIVIHFRGNDEFERLFEQLCGRSTLDYPDSIPA